MIRYNPLIKKLVILLITQTGFFLFCQSPFSIREPEPPATIRSTWIPPYSPEQVFSNFQNAISERNVENYTRCFTDTSKSTRMYRFNPEPEIESTYPTIFLFWSREAEKNVMQQLFSSIPSDSTLFVKFTEEATDIITADSAVFNRLYHLEVHHTESSLPAIYDGHGEFWLAPDATGEWAIYRWIDHRLNENPSWSTLKAALGS